MKLYCKKCNHLLVENLSEAKKKEIVYEDGYDLIPEGKYIHSTDIGFNIYEVSYLMNIKSVPLKNYTNNERMQGCCGPSGLDGLNQLCLKCSEEIGVLVADCIAPYFIGIQKNKVSLEPLW